METRFETAFLKAVKKHASIKKLAKKEVDIIIENPIAIGEPLKGNWQGFYSCPVKRNFIIIYLPESGFAGGNIAASGNPNFGFVIFPRPHHEAQAERT